jgi:hypothetical protein
MEVSGQVHALTALTPEEKIPVPVDYESGRIKSRCVEKVKSLPPTGIEPRFHGFPAASLIVIITEIT